eukprot:m.100059 g.100059  ORF g.100059 m.100059 type:complete len:417 (-) comp15374_c0_seq1:642-1892(-)
MKAHACSRASGRHASSSHNAPASAQAPCSHRCITKPRASSAENSSSGKNWVITSPASCCIWPSLSRVDTTRCHCSHSRTSLTTEDSRSCHGAESALSTTTRTLPSSATCLSRCMQRFHTTLGVSPSVLMWSLPASSSTVLARKSGSPDSQTWWVYFLSCWLAYITDKLVLPTPPNPKMQACPAWSRRSESCPSCLSRPYQYPCDWGATQAARACLISAVVGPPGGGEQFSMSVSLASQLACSATVKPELWTSCTNAPRMSSKKPWGTTVLGLCRKRLTLLRTTTTASPGKSWGRRSDGSAVPLDVGSSWVGVGSPVSVSSPPPLRARIPIRAAARAVRSHSLGTPVCSFRSKNRSTGRPLSCCAFGTYDTSHSSATPVSTKGSLSTATVQAWLPPTFLGFEEMDTGLHHAEAPRSP